MGYHCAGFDEIVGVDIAPQKRYPFEFVRGDALEYVARHGHEFDVIHASPPCQVYSKTVPLSNGNHPDLVEPTRDLLIAAGKPYIIENVRFPGAPLINPITLCGAMFGLRVIRKRLFETCPIVIFTPPIMEQVGRCAPRGVYDRGQYGLITVVGNNFSPKFARLAMGIDWMTRDELSQAIPPAYTEWLGRQILELIQ
jgi:DNA (cytosine-5)-methyltransferase 1